MNKEYLKYNLSTWLMWIIFGFVLILILTQLSIPENICISILYGSLMAISQSAINAANNKDRRKKQ